MYRYTNILCFLAIAATATFADTSSLRNPNSENAVTCCATTKSNEYVRLIEDHLHKGLGTERAIPGNVSISLDDVEIADVVRMFTRISGANIIADPHYLNGRCTANLDNVQWNVALKIILSMHRLDLVKTPGHDIYHIEPKPGYVSWDTQYQDDDSSDLWGYALLALLIVALLPGVFHGTRYLYKAIRFLLRPLRRIAWHRIGRRLLLFSFYGFLSLFYGTALIAYFVLRILTVAGMTDAESLWTTLFLPSLALLVLLTVALRYARRWRGKVGPGTRWAIRIAFLLPAIALVTDSPEPTRLYSWDDLTHPAHDAAESSQLLDQLTTKDAIRIEIPNDFWQSGFSATGVIATAELIEQVWTNAVPGRDIVQDLDGFDYIAEVIGPEDCDWNAPYPSFLRLRDLATAYRHLALLRCAQGQHGEGISALAEIHSVARKLGAGSRTLVARMIAVALMRANIETAHIILTQTDCSEDDVRALQKAFPPLTPSDIYMTPSLVAEVMFFTTLLSRDDFPPRFLQFFHSYLMPQEFVSGCGSTAKVEAELIVYGENGSTNQVFRELREIESGKKSVSYDDPIPYPGFWERVASRTIAFLFYSPNRTISAMERSFLPNIESAAEPWPPNDNDAHSSTFATRPDIRNLGGSLIVSMATPSFFRAHETISKTIIQADLLALTLSDRLGEGKELRDHANSGWYELDEVTGTRFSSGPDAIVGNEDDVRLEWEF